MAAAVCSERKSMRAISAPRSQRDSMNLRVTSPSSRIARRTLMRRASPDPEAATRSDHRNAERRSVQSISLDLAFAVRSSESNSAAIWLAFAEQPASFSSSA